MVVKRWEYREVDQIAARKIAAKLGLSMITAQILVNRGITTVEEAQEFFQLDLDHLLDPFLLHDMEIAINRLVQGFQKGERMVIFGDYDVDGITGTSTLYRVFKKVGANVDYYIPDRSEGYGLNEDAVRRLAQSGYTLILTVDNGISCLKEVEVANAVGIDVIITDHHEPPEKVPNAVAVINPKLECCQYPFPELAGVGVGFKLCQALAQRLNSPALANYVLEQLDLVTLGTIADIVPLVKENRVIAANGLKMIEKTKNPGLRELIKVSGLQDRTISAGHIGFGLGPRINAIGRIDNPILGVELFTTDNREYATELAEKMDQANRKRQMIEEKIMNQAVEMIEAGGLNQSHGIVLASPDWSAGVIGIVASKLVERYYRPTILIAIQEDGIGKGSARGIRGIHLYDALNFCGEYLNGYGGHEMAAGLSVNADQIDVFRQAFQKYAEKVLTSNDLVPYIKIDAEVQMNNLDFTLLNELEKLEPHGMGNARPLFAIRKVAHQHRLVGSLEEHLKIDVSNGKKRISGIGFRMADKVSELKVNQKIDVTFSLERNVWQGRESLQMVLSDLKGTEISYVEELYEQAEMSLHRPINRWFTQEELIDGQKRRQLLSELTDQESLHQLGDFLMEDFHLSSSTPETDDLPDSENVPTQVNELLQLLFAGKNILRVSSNHYKNLLEMMTYVFYQGIRNQKITCILYPHRGMVENQYKLLKRYIPGLGMRIYRSSNLLTFQEQSELNQVLESGELDLLLTTPEYLEVYLDKFKLLRGYIRFLVIEEVEQFGSFTKEYISNLSDQLDQPQILSTTTQGIQAFQEELVDRFELDDVLVDTDRWTNLQVIDQRKVRKKDAYLTQLLHKQGKLLVFVNSPEMSIVLAQRLRQSVPELEEKILFYHERLSYQEQLKIEADFKQSKIKVLVSTQAFGLMQIPDIRHIVIYHLSSHQREFLQQIRMGTLDGQHRWVHLMYGVDDQKLVQKVLDRVGPGRELLVKIYLLLQKLTDAKDQIRLSPHKLAESFGTERESVLIGLKVFEELELLQIEEERSQFVVKLLPKPKQKLDLYSSIMYNEGTLDKKYFNEFCQMAFAENVEKLVGGVIASPLSEIF